MRLLSHVILLHASLAGILAFLSQAAAAGLSQRLSDGWEYHQGSLGSTWEIWRGEAASDNVTWTPVTLPHCFNARDAVRCDNSRDAESIPSDLSDFNRYGGIYRHVTLTYVPAISLQRVHVEPVLSADGKASVKVRSRLFNPADLSDPTELVLEITDPSGKIVHRASQSLAPWSGDREINAFEIAKPILWSPRSPALYQCIVTLKSKDGDWSESYVVNLFDWHLKEQEQMPNLTGAAQWIFKDFSTPLRPENPVPYVNQKGVVERDGTPKESYYVYQSYWAEKPMIHIYGHSWPIRWGGPNETKEVKVYSNCKEVELFVNGVSVGIKQRDVTQYPAAGLSWQVPFKPGANTLRAVSGELADEITFFYQTQSWGEPAKLELKEISRAGDIVTLETRVFDAKGMPCLDAAQLVSFGFTGDGKLLDNLGTASGSRKVQLANGRAKIRVHLTGNAAATVTAEGLETVVLPLKNSR